MAKYLIFGKNGQLGKEFVKTFEKEKKEFYALEHKECDISDLSSVLEVFKGIKPDVVINCAAYNQVDKAEEDYRTAIKVNSLGVRNLAFASKRFNAFLIHYSTDYVFDGEKEDGLCTEEDNPNPLNEYGKSKLLGEIFLKEETEKYLIFRTSWVYGEGKQNFIYKLMQWAKDNDYLKVAYDEISVPTSTRTIVEVSLKAVEQGLTGLYHLTNSGYASRYEWAKKVFEIKGIKKFIKPVSSDIFNLPAKRPKFSAMGNDRIKNILKIDIIEWEEEIKRYLRF
ncbi:dTDP-4-dehydrorhamnose reductase [Persephonella atlantica]|uniref:dTDP-4-dehydrorhamnose reductase n=1 Tax=Persephonella atlantica TaxID=2699429 RepID=A0ABS1GJX0_9AQUI|nr:dTDP-4-dehydrorhamnose reductase [Persephonella atlantica]MBK3333185.1 dTDP-4-dehydrorhamnose reductase [Persephonella atlantica]